uniref:Uncharacterized protein LOC111132775 n=1 Tax=Crassostrea virginica TaxID=6565 RepID=A0A8B8E9Z1_CRAVI|nr:uncharacterized protein LOC111132775 [Crassostrea virginica]
MKKQEEALLKEIDAIIQGKHIEIDVMDSKHQIALDKQEEAINNITTEIKQVIQDLKSLLDTGDDSVVLNYQFRIEEFRNLPYKVKGEVLRSVQTISVNRPEGIALTRSGDLVYADYDDRSINLVSGTQVEPLITLQGWKPRGLCSTSSGDLQVIMDSDDEKQTKVKFYPFGITTDSHANKLIADFDNQEVSRGRTFTIY